AAGASDTAACLYDIQSGACSKTLKGHKGPVAALAFDPDGKRLVTAAHDDIHIWSIATGKQETRWSASVIVMKPGETIQEANLREGMLPGMLITCAAWSPDGKLMAAAANNGNIRLHDAAGKLIKNFNISYPLSFRTRVGLTSLRFTPDSQGLLYTGIDKHGAGTAGILDLATDKPRVEFSGHNNDALLAGTYSRPDGTVVHVVGSYITPA